MTFTGHQRRRPAARPDRWLLALVTLVLALGVVVMHSLGIGHHGPSHLAPGGHSMATAGAAGAHEATHHQSSATEPTVVPGPGPGHDPKHGAGSVASHVLNDETSDGTAGSAPAVAERVVAAGASHGATVMCLAVLPLLVLLRRRGGGAWFARAVAAARRPAVPVRAWWSVARPRPPGSILTELCILRT
ncbi:hypothetical protein [Humibacillus xanthopallidus]|uniref:Uncharacterized protein n=1 Tax=Humibacillus xanthopallidus TaxID=412689 RepID=A0A543I1K7_9MICO|nr:hypothetical protein [Humibacillus xanthopallidus]TQM64474.1 hypothetical protein FBY41_0841 [Humibacillus xanthopallidus]